MDVKGEAFQENSHFALIFRFSPLRIQAEMLLATSAATSRVESITEPSVATAARAFSNEASEEDPSTLA
jgi:hypothetical protein